MKAANASMVDQASRFDEASMLDDLLCISDKIGPTCARLIEQCRERLSDFIPSSVTDDASLEPLNTYSTFFFDRYCH
jgi:hypothetical protein